VNRWQRGNRTSPTPRDTPPAAAAANGKR